MERNNISIRRLQGPQDTQSDHMAAPSLDVLTIVDVPKGLLPIQQRKTLLLFLGIIYAATAAAMTMHAHTRITITYLSKETG